MLKLPMMVLDLSMQLLQTCKIVALVLSPFHIASRVSAVSVMKRQCTGVSLHLTDS